MLNLPRPLLLTGLMLFALLLAACQGSPSAIPDSPRYVALDEDGAASEERASASEADRQIRGEYELTAAIIGQPETPAPQYSTGQEVIPVVTGGAAGQNGTPGDTAVTREAASAALESPAAEPLAGLVLGPFNHVPHRLMASEARKYARENGGFELEVTHADTAVDVEKQIAAIRKLVSGRAVVIALAPADPYSHDLAQAIKAAGESGLAVVTFDRPMNAEALAAAGLPELPFVGPDNQAGAEQVAARLAATLKPGAKVAIINDESAYLAGSRAAAERKRGFEQALEKASLKLSGTVAAGTSAEAAGDAVRAALREQRDLQGLLITGPDAAYGAVLAVEEAKREGRVSLAAYGASPELDELILEGRLLVTVDDFYQTWAVEALKKGFENVARQPGERNAGGWSVTPHKLVTKENPRGLSSPAGQ